MSIKFIFFDIDQTLVDYSGAVNNAVIRLIQEEPILNSVSSGEFLSIWNALRSRYTQPALDGRTSLTKLRLERMKHLIQYFGLIVSQSEIEQLTLKLFELSETLCSAFPDVNPVLNDLVGYRLGVITNGKEAVQRKKLAHANLSYTFNPFIASVEYQCAKPSQQIFKYALEKANISSKHCVMIGDNLELDILPAKKLGFQAIFLNRKVKNKYQKFQVPQIENLYQLRLFL